MSRQLIPCIRNLSECFNKDIHDNDFSQRIHRFEKIKSHLPENAIIGYLGDSENLSYEENSVNHALTQYALAPIIVLRSDTLETIIADSQNSIDTIKWKMLYSWNNLMLLKRK